MTIRTIHIIGDRQAGKTEAAISYALALIHGGVYVAYYTESHYTVRDALYRCEQSLLPGQRMYKGSGAERVEDPDGGVLHFTTFRRMSKERDAGIHTVILDDFSASAQWDADGIQIRHPRVTNIVRVTL